jgi:WD40 repeat protein
MDGQSSFFRAGGTMEPNAPSYIVRVADAQLLQALLAGEYVFLLDSRQKGKSSLVARTMLGLRDAGVATIKLDLQRVGANVTPEQWYAGLLMGVGLELNLDRDVFAFWESHPSIGPLARWLGAIETVVLRHIQQQLVIFIDEVDFVRALPFATDEFFAGIRDCYNRRSEGRGFDRLTFCLVGVATPGQLIRNPDITPFNVGTRIELVDFTYNDTAGYAVALDEAGFAGEETLRRVHYWVNGHPYLTQLLCSHLVSRPTDVDELVKALLLSPESRQREANLGDVERRMLDPDIPGLSAAERRSQVLELYRRLLRGRPIAAEDENPLIAVMKLSGVSKEEGGKLLLRNRLYETIFNAHWIKASLPDAERRRQKAAARSGAIRVAGVSVVVLAIFAAIATYTWNLSVERSLLVAQSRRIAAAAEKRAYNSSMYLLSEQAGRGNWLSAGDLLDKTEDSPARGWEWQFWRNRLNNQVRTMRSQPGGGFIAFTKDGFPTVVTPRQLILTTGATIDLRNQPDGEEFWLRHLVQHLDTKGLRSAAGVFAHPPGTNEDRTSGISNDGKIVITRNREAGTITAWRRNETRMWSMAVAPPVNVSVTFSSDGTQMAASVLTAGIETIDPSTGLVRLRIPIAGVNGLRFSPNGLLIAAVTNDHTCVLFDSQSGKRILTLTGHTMPVQAVTFSSDGALLATSGYDGTIRLWSMPSGQPIAVLVGHRAAVSSCEFAPDGKTLVSRAQDGEVREWSVQRPTSIELLRIHKDQVVRLELSPDSSRLATSSADETVVLYDLPHRRIVRRIAAGPIKKAHALSFSKSGALLAVSLPSGAVGLFDAGTGNLRSEFRGHSEQVNKVQFCNNDKMLLTVSDDGTAKVWSVPDGETLGSYDVAPGIATAAVDRDGHFVALALKDFGVQIFRFGSPKPVQKWQPHRSTIYSMEFSPDGKTVATVSYDGTGMLLPVAGGKPLGLYGHVGRLWEVQFAGNGKAVVTNANDGSARLWNARTGEPLSVMRHDSWVAGAEYSPDGSRIITCSADNTIRIWDPETGDELTSLHGHTQPVFRAKISHELEFLVSASSDGTVRIWHSRHGQ